MVESYYLLTCLHHNHSIISSLISHSYVVLFVVARSPCCCSCSLIGSQLRRSTQFLDLSSYHSNSVPTSCVMYKYKGRKEKSMGSEEKGEKGCK